MESLVRVTRRGGVILVALLSVACSLMLVYLVFNRGAVSHLPTLHLLGLVGSLLLPIATLGLLRLDQVTVHERGSGR